ncbi:hypothetical protein PCCS19_00740 [Paenibacillus sp. CCS19]|uniref:hypothetical protein n=1 Tax=Paenibacillus sp. CCS19 TaxID=3158387 RepID=UPI002565CDC6|nr:hypothetical protein [Paenibacillus cellulosilyticus]GMK37021.1 hypothetical protein PCCS19_00740 [Paenibacillus cellulosilyticus]
MEMSLETVDEVIIDPAYLQTLLRRVVLSECLLLLSWDCSPLGKIKGESSVYRVACTTLDNQIEQKHTLILKLLKSDSLRDQVDHYHYWKREALIYESAILRQLPFGIRAPICHAVEEHPDDTVWIWLEDIAIEDIQSDEWSFEQMCKISYLLGTYNGAYLTGTPLPAESFLCRNWLRSWVEVCTAYAKPIEKHQVIWDSCLNDCNGTSLIWELYLRNRNRVNSLLDTIEKLPRVFAHQDVHWENIFLAQQDGTASLIAIDWQFASISGVGEELGRMFGYALMKNKIPMSKIEMYKEELFQCYLQGLRDRGWLGDYKLVRFGFIASASLRFILVMDKLVGSLTEDKGINKEKSRHLLLVAQTLLELAEESWELVMGNTARGDDQVLHER